MFLCMTFQIIGLCRGIRIRFLRARCFFFPLLLRKFWIRIWFYNCQPYLCLIRIPVLCTLNKRGQETRLVLPTQLVSSVLSTLDRMFCFLPAHFMSSAYTDKNNPFSWFADKQSQFRTFLQSCSSHYGTFSQPWPNRNFLKLPLIRHRLETQFSLDQDRWRPFGDDHRALEGGPQQRSGQRDVVADG